MACPRRRRAPRLQPRPAPILAVAADNVVVDAERLHSSVVKRDTDGLSSRPAQLVVRVRIKPRDLRDGVEQVVRHVDRPRS